MTVIHIVPLFCIYKILRMELGVIHYVLLVILLTNFCLDSFSLLGSLALCGLVSHL